MSNRDSYDEICSTCGKSRGSHNTMGDGTILCSPFSRGTTFKGSCRFKTKLELSVVREIAEKVVTLTSERKFYQVALPVVRGYLLNEGTNDWEFYYKRIHAAVLTAGHSVPHTQRNRFCEEIIEYYRGEATETPSLLEERAQYDFAAKELDDAVERLSNMVVDSSTLMNTSINQEETKTMTIKVETFTFVNNIKFGDLSNTLCYDHIKNSEKQIDKLKDMKTQPKSALKTISELEQGIADLVQLMDKRTEDANDE